MNELTVRNVDVLGDSITAAKDKDGIVWAGVSYFCRALGMSKVQKDTQTDKVQSDKTLSRGCRKFPAGVFDTANETVAIRIDFIPIWLAKISITDKMQKTHPELADKLLEYQLKAKDILAQAFMPKQGLPQTIPEQIQLLAQGNVELNKRVDDIQAEVEHLKLDLPILPIEAEKITNATRAKGVSVMGGKGSNAYANRSIVNAVYKDIYGQIYRNFGVKSYKAIKRSQTDKVIMVIEEYKPPVVLQDRIDGENAQQTLNLKGGVFRG